MLKTNKLELPSKGNPNKVVLKLTTLHFEVPPVKLNQLDKI